MFDPLKRKSHGGGVLKSLDTAPRIGLRKEKKYPLSGVLYVLKTVVNQLKANAGNRKIGYSKVD